MPQRPCGNSLVWQQPALTDAVGMLGEHEHGGAAPQLPPMTKRIQPSPQLAEPLRHRMTSPKTRGEPLALRHAATVCERLARSGVNIVNARSRDVCGQLDGAQLAPAKGSSIERVATSETCVNERC
ncbi:hypothetical protein PHYPSEUDO_001816 [Phytophthora pseudosyringae]|uniref:Uncharacterized protein n=1 Tax=Phytophthora pseudosyringae TaxID=221518 RepID=A0A8T1V5E4_9STRA|nr:hypothetical protein PHYPSEUDO_001816 [Phytophthora pseudosyringae]